MRKLPTSPPPQYLPARREAAGLVAKRALYAMGARVVQLWTFQALVALSKKDFRNALKIADRVLSAFPDHKQARQVAARARAGLGQGQHLGADQAVIEDDLCLLQRLQNLQGQKTRITGAGAGKSHLTGHKATHAAQNVSGGGSGM